MISFERLGALRSTFFARIGNGAEDGADGWASFLDDFFARLVARVAAWREANSDHFALKNAAASDGGEEAGPAASEAAKNDDEAPAAAPAEASEAGGGSEAAASAPDDIDLLIDELFAPPASGEADLLAAFQPPSEEYMRGILDYRFQPPLDLSPLEFGAAG